jgi:hypothetical protein
VASTCCVCQKEREGGETFVLTDEEKAAIGPTAPDEIYYCKPCLKVMQDRQGGAQLLKGLYEMGLREAGVGQAQELAKRFHTNLLKGKNGNDN